MSVKVTDNTRNITNRVRQRASIFLRTVADDVVETSKRKTPKREGFLRRDIVRRVLGLKGQVRWRKNYAAKMETVQFRNYTTPGTGPHYAEDAIKRSIKRTGSIARRVGLI